MVFKTEENLNIWPGKYEPLNCSEIKHLSDLDQAEKNYEYLCALSKNGLLSRHVIFQFPILMKLQLHNLDQIK